MSTLCTHHIGVKNRYGHHAGRRVLPTEYAGAMEEVSALLSKNMDHPGVQGGLLRIESLFRLHAQGTKNAGIDAEFRHLKGKEVTPLQVLTAVAGARLWVARNPYACPDIRAEDFLVSTVVGRLAPRPRSGGYPTKTSLAYRAYAGKALREALTNSLLVNLTVTCQDRAAAQIAQQNETHAAAIAPFQS